MTPRWWSQPFPPEGATASEGIRRQLGAPSLDLLTVLVRETAGNSLDAGPAPSRASYSHMNSPPTTRPELKEWQGLLLPVRKIPTFSASTLLETPFVARVGSRYDAAWRTAPKRHRDRRTARLRELRPERWRSERPRVWRGTYGFGKGVLLLSQAHTILVDTRCQVEGRQERRLLGASLGISFARAGRRFTGRHWWGVVHDDIPDPLLDEEASAAAFRLGLPGFRSGELGTDIVVVAPHLGELQDESPRSNAEAGRHLVSAVDLAPLAKAHQPGGRPATNERSRSS